MLVNNWINYITDCVDIVYVCWKILFFKRLWEDCKNGDAQGGITKEIKIIIGNWDAKFPLANNLTILFLLYQDGWKQRVFEEHFL